jgi:hypothetical protein
MHKYPFLVGLAVLIAGWMTCAFLAASAWLCLRHVQRGDYRRGILFGLATVAIPIPITVFFTTSCHSAVRTVIALIICVLSFVPWCLIAACIRQYRLPPRSSGEPDQLVLAAVLLVAALVPITWISFVAVGLALFWEMP